MSLIVRKELQSTRIEDNQCTEASLQSAVEAAEESCGESGAECIFLVEAVLEMRLVWLSSTVLRCSLLRRAASLLNSLLYSC